MKIHVITAIGLCCFECVFIAGSAAGSSDPGFPSDPQFEETDRMFREVAELEAGFVRRCIKGKSKAAAEVAERVKTMDGEIEKELGKRPPPPVKYPPEVELAVCDEKMPFIKTVQALTDIGKKDLVVRYYSCAALARNDRSVCDSIRFIHIPPASKPGGEAIATDVDCADHFLPRYLLSRALITNDPSAGKLCEEICGKLGFRTVFGTDRDLPGDVRSCEAICSLEVKHRDEPGNFCDEALPFFKRSALAVKACEDRYFSRLVGLGPLPSAEMLKMLHEPDFCAPGHPCFEFDEINDHCFDYAAFRKAFGAGNKELCGDSGICRAMMGQGPDACQPYADAARWEVCGEREKARKLAEWDRRNELAVRTRRSVVTDEITRFNNGCSKRLDQIKAVDERISASIDQILPDTPGFELRNEKLASAVGRHRRLREEFNFIPAHVDP